MSGFVGIERIRRVWLDAVQAGPSLLQGHRIARNIPRLEEAAGPNLGLVDAAGSGGVPLRLLVIGDSNVAGAGAPTHSVALTGQLAVRLSARRHRPVAWEADGANGATMERIRHEVLGLIQEHDPDIVVLVAGANDAMSGRSPVHWGSDLRAVLGAFLDPGRDREIVVAGVPPFRYFPALPAPLNEFLERRASRLDAVSAGVCAELGLDFVSFADGPPLGEAFFATDRFHASVAGYGYWAGFLLEVLQDRRSSDG
ncbi:SGNH/GDSL hydrolase family protein [Paeniglutamicibacter psychrophenolicus]|uniref:SGNH/GDSL hydrolase family protein n=1 Tax=Paeniglutamicibacter psychrophenolicus TaxID=257454 RepID=UPI0027852CE7|nr:SGNH/GDSL hydrolase family protein [Paeniglutamicibacter psychrophenolicus]MDQ0095588.1 lysophospholipase L1-like esterase [Paeniglutamicibacter psychrophenolicus]